MSGTAQRGEAPPTTAYSDADDLLLVLADALDDVENARRDSENRLRSLTMPEEKRGKAQATTGRAAQALTVVKVGLVEIEHRLVRDLEKAMAAHPLGPLVQRTCGFGLKRTARMLATIGDPLYNTAENRPRRGPGELWQFCGHGDPDRSRLRKGQPVEHNPTAKMRVHLVAESCMMARASPYRPVYDQARAKYADAVHRSECVRCGPSGHPALAGSPLSDGHKHARALRLVGKAILLDLYRVAAGQPPKYASD